jgi:3'-phosphoadenosine 5'-phosphosulfate sulfotransferase (PAPS reductase)/FAD synthetase
MTSSNAQERSMADYARSRAASAETVLRWALDTFSPKVALACSFQAEESVLIDMMHGLRGADFRIFTLDTGRLNQETYDCMDAIRRRYGVSVEVFFPRHQSKFRTWCGRTASIFSTTRWNRESFAVPCARSSR